MTHLSHHHRPRLADSGRTFFAAAMITTAALLTGCAGGGQDAGTAPSAGVELALGHVHGLGMDPSDNTLYVASHVGVFKVAPGQAPERVADRWQDTMAFTVTGPRRFLASGHPDLNEDLPVQLGLIESTDGAETWRPVSLQGKADFHALEVVGDRVVGYDSLSGQLLVSDTKRRTWRSLGKLDVIDLASPPGQTREVLATTPDGLKRVDLTSRSPAPEALDGAPPLVSLEWPDAKTALGLSAEGTIYRSADAGDSWLEVATAPAQPEAFDATSSTWHVANPQGVFRSDDEGRTWRSVLLPQ